MVPNLSVLHAPHNGITWAMLSFTLSSQIQKVSAFPNWSRDSAHDQPTSTRSAAHYSKRGSPTACMQVASGCLVGSSRKALNMLLTQELVLTTPWLVPGNRKK
jgi:hypothetical protein